MILPNAEAILEHAKMAKIQFQVKNNKLIVEAAAGVITDSLKQCLLKNKESIIFILNHHGISENELKAFLDKDWNDYKDNPAALFAWADLLVKRKLIEQSKVPANFTAEGVCKGCGKIFLPPEYITDRPTISCPWCHNRINGLPIPKPH